MPASSTTPCCAAGSRLSMSTRRRLRPSPKHYGRELDQRRHEAPMSAGGIDALDGERERARGGARPRAWLRTKANSIEGGKTDVMLGIVAKRILDLAGA